MLTIYEDVRNKLGHHQLKNDAWAAHGVNVVRNKLPYGDYARAFDVTVDTKKDIQELCMDVFSDHRRFRDSAILAMECGSVMVVVVENEDGVRSLEDLEKWVEPDKSFNLRKKRNANAKRWEGSTLAAACRTMWTRYGLEFDFCAPDEAWNVVMRHLGVVM